MYKHAQCSTCMCGQTEFNNNHCHFISIHSCFILGQQVYMGVYACTLYACIVTLLLFIHREDSFTTMFYTAEFEGFGVDSMVCVYRYHTFLCVLMQGFQYLLIEKYTSVALSGNGIQSFHWSRLSAKSFYGITRQDESRKAQSVTHKGQL